VTSSVDGCQLRAAELIEYADLFTRLHRVLWRLTLRPTAPSGLLAYYKQRVSLQSSGMSCRFSILPDYLRQVQSVFGQTLAASEPRNAPSIRTCLWLVTAPRSVWSRIRRLAWPLIEIARGSVLHALLLVAGDCVNWPRSDRSQSSM